jgi:uncharacterized RDD family membrane protein YckC
VVGFVVSGLVLLFVVGLLVSVAVLLVSLVLLSLLVGLGSMVSGLLMFFVAAAWSLGLFVIRANATVGSREAR